MGTTPAAEVSLTGKAITNPRDLEMVSDPHG
jgi:hypothetical protein